MSHPSVTERRMTHTNILFTQVTSLSLAASKALVQLKIYFKHQPSSLNNLYY